jgi:hypothetical protein
VLPVAWQTFSLSNRCCRFLRIAILLAHEIVRRGNFVNCCVAFMILPLNGTSPMRRNLSWLPLVVLAITTGGTIALAQPQGGMPPRATDRPSDRNTEIMQNVATCSNCKKEVRWTGILVGPRSCPHCKVKFDYIEGADGRKTTPMGSNYTNAPKYIGIGIGVIFVIIIVAVKLAMTAAASRPKRSAKRSAKRRKPRRRDEDDED